MDKGNSLFIYDGHHRRYIYSGHKKAASYRVETRFEGGDFAEPRG
jgi:hypothetical protein